MAPKVLLCTGLLLLGLAVTGFTASTGADVHPPEPPIPPCIQPLEARCPSDQRCNCTMPEEAEEEEAARAQQNFYHRLLMLLEILRQQR